MDENNSSGQSVKQTYTAKEVADILGVSIRTIYNLCESTKDFKVLRIGKHCLRINKESFDKRYKTPKGPKQQWETYDAELEAIQRKGHIDFLEKNKQHDDLTKAAAEYREKRAMEKAMLALEQGKEPAKGLPAESGKDNMQATLNLHILPYFGDRVMSLITAEDIDNFVDYLATKPCSGSKSCNKEAEDIPLLSSGTIKKCYTIFTSGFMTAKAWKFISEIPQTTAPSEKTAKRSAWESSKVLTALKGMEDNKLLHLAVHIAFVCSLRAGETAGIDIKTIDFADQSLWITQEVQRVSDKALSVIPKNEIVLVFPKQKKNCKSSMILKGPKTEGSYRKQYLTAPLLQEIQARLDEIERYKQFLGDEYIDYGLLICNQDGRPIDPRYLDRWFKKWQTAEGIDTQIEFQGLRKSGQMHKVRLTKNNYQLVAENSGQSPEVLMSNYNEALDCEKRELSMLIEGSFYESDAEKNPPMTKELGEIFEALQSRPELTTQILQLLTANAPLARQDIT